MTEHTWRWEPLDQHLAQFLGQLNEKLSLSEEPYIVQNKDDSAQHSHYELLEHTIRLLSHQVRQGDTCLELKQYAHTQLVLDDKTEIAIELPDLETWQAYLQGLGLIESIRLDDALVQAQTKLNYLVSQEAANENIGQYEQADNTNTLPLVLEDSRVYFQRYWYYEQALAAHLLQRRQIPHHRPDTQWLETQLAELFPHAMQAVDWQCHAVRQTLHQGISIISGGPGTGKTTVIARLLILLLRWQPELRFALAAPTGKAAARMQEAIRQNCLKLQLSDDEKAKLPENARTLHRLLGYLPNQSRFRHHAMNPIPADVVIVDEASMVDLALMYKLIDAVHPEARLILLGDRNQLASVETGTVLGEICAVAEQDNSPLQTNVTFLQHSYRFDDNSGIGQLAHAINQGDEVRALTLLDDSAYPDIVLLDDESLLQKILLDNFAQQLAIWRQPMTVHQDDFRTFEQFQLLSPHRRGRRGVEGLNRYVETLLRQHGVISKQAYWYQGKPILIQQNHYALGLFNGDIGITRQHDDGRFRVHFPSNEGDNLDFPLARLPNHETAWAMTVHKSQGSEFDEIMLVLPEKTSAVLTRELLYTAVTRARSKLFIYGHCDMIREAIRKPVQRQSGLAEKLRTS